MGLNHDDVVAILALLDASDFDELRLEMGDYKLHVRRSAPLAPANGAPAGTSDSPAAAPAASPPVPPPPVPPVPPPAPANASAAGSAVDVKTPLLGTFYRSPQPGAAPFVDIGSAVEADTVIGIVEVMKLMSSVAAGTRGVVAEIVAGDGQLVEYGEVLMRIAPRGA